MLLPRRPRLPQGVRGVQGGAPSTSGQPTVILAQTVKGWTIDALEGKNATHQMKKLTTDDLKAFRDRLYLPIPDSAARGRVQPAVLPPGRRTPRRSSTCRSAARRSAATSRSAGSTPTIIKLPGDEVVRAADEGPGKQTKVATTHGVRPAAPDLMRDKEIGHRIVPIAPDESRTFGMDSMFPTAKIYNPHGPDVRVGRPQAAAVLQGVRAGPDAARGHLRGRRDGLD